ncbi:MAG: hypothetical protein GX936_03305, partial [Clostridiales bacterium]|nr:hypothetical protein [Clostridiales bacterium]
SVSEKKLTGNEDFEHQGRYKEVIMAIQELLSELREMIKRTGKTAQQVASKSEQLAQCAQSLAQGSSEQAAAIEEVVAMVGEIVIRTRKSSEDALHSMETVELLHRQAEEGDEKMKRLLVALAEINEASLNISKFIKTIEDIAFQTNILALNASVEAAHAGVHGKGFAVVAEEVKNLAVRSATAANETKALINTSVTKAKDGAAIGEDMRKSLDSMTAGINEVLTAIKEIAAESRRQVEIIDQLNEGLERISQVVQSNTAAAEESASSSEELLSQAKLMNEMVSIFKVE